MIEMGPSDEKLNESTMGITQNSFAEQQASFAMISEKKIEVQHALALPSKLAYSPKVKQPNPPRGALP